MTPLAVIRKATPDDLAAARGFGRPSIWDGIAPQLNGEWVVVFDGDEADAKKIASNNKAAKRYGIETRRSGGMVLARRELAGRPHHADGVETVVKDMRRRGLL